VSAKQLNRRRGAVLFTPDEHVLSLRSGSVGRRDKTWVIV